MLSKTAQPEVTKNPSASPIELAASLLAPTRRQEHLKNIKTLLHLPPKLFDALYYRVIERFAEFVQNLPETLHGAFANPGGFLDHGLERASRALTLCLSYFFPEEQSFHSISSEQALWIYAVFTAALLLDIGKLAVKYQITLCNKDGSTIREWLPYSGAMVGQAKYYKYAYLKENRDHLRRLVTGILARQLLTESDTTGAGSATTGGFNWIASNPVVLEAWLNMLAGDARNITSYLTVVPYADQLAIENYLANLKAMAAASKNSLFGTGLFDSQENPFAEIAAGKDFQEWLRAHIANDKLSVNQEDSLIHRTEEGLIIDIAQLIERFLKDNPQLESVQMVKSQFMQLMELYNIPFTQLGKEYALLKGSVASVRFQNWLLVYKPDFLVILGKQISVNPNIAKVPEQNLQQDNAPINTRQQEHNAKLQHR